MTIRLLLLVFVTLSALTSVACDEAQRSKILCAVGLCPGTGRM